MNDLKPFYKYVKKEKNYYLWAFVGSVFRFLIPLSVPLIMKYIFDSLLQNNLLSQAEKMERLLFMAVCMIVVFIFIRTPMEYVRQYCLHKANNNIIKALRQDTFQKVHSLDAKYFTDNKSGEIGTRFFDDIEKVKGFLTAFLGNMWIEMIVLAFVVITMFMFHIPLTLLAIGLVSFQFILAHFLSKKFKISTRNMMNYRSVLSGFIFEKIQGTFISKLFGSEKRDQKELDQHLEQFEVLTNKHAKINATMLSLVNVLSDMTPFIVVLVASRLVMEGNLTVGSLIAFYAYVDKMRSPVAALVQAFPAITEGRVALKRILDFFQIPSTIVDKTDSLALREFKENITFENVSFSYNENHPVLKNISFTLEKGKKYAFVGESGGGKSTILQLLLRLYDVNSGKVLIDNVPIQDYALSTIREQIGIVTQDNFLYSSSIKENIKMAKPEATDEEMVFAAKKAHAHDFISLLEDGYNTEIGERGIKLSGGQKQRIALARVFLKNPSIMILDEATSALDNESEKLVQNSIQKLDQNKTILMIAHRLSTIVNADTIFVLKNGEIIESGNHHTLLGLNGYYRELYSKQNPDELKRKVGKAS